MKRMLPIQIPRTWKRQCVNFNDSDSHESVGGCPSESGSESVYSLQQHDTDLAKDTSDTSIDTEYEVANSSPRQSNPLFSTDDSDELHDLNEIAELGVVAATVGASLDDEIDLGQLADTSVEASSSPTSNSDVDPGLPRQDYLYFWTCTQCNAENENRHVPFCSKCYTKRKKFFPLRPRRHRGALGPIPVSTSLTATDSAISVDTVDAPIPLRSSAKSETDSGVDSVDGPGPSNNLCQICYNKPADGMFAHGKTAHKYGCYSCAKQTWKVVGHCPLCRRRIDKVYKAL